MVKGSAFPLVPGKWMISAGTFHNTNAIRCFEDAVITVTSIDGSTTDYLLPAGTDTSISFPHISILVVSGVVSIADNTLV